MIISDSPELQKKVIELSNKGISRSKIATIVNSSIFHINNIYKKNNIPLTRTPARKHNTNESYFNIIDTESKAYILGFLYADGCITDQGFQICLKNDKDNLDLLLYIKKEVESTYSPKICFQKIKGIEEKKKILFFRIYSPKMSLSLQNLGCTKKKSQKLNFPTNKQVPEYLIRHFIRGYFDGDGHISVKNISQKSQSCTFNLISTKSFNEKCRQIINKKINIDLNEGQFKKHISSNINYLVYNRRGVLSKLKNFLYNDASFYLQRKYKTFNSLVSKDYTPKNSNIKIDLIDILKESVSGLTSTELKKIIQNKTKKKEVRKFQNFLRSHPNIVRIKHTPGNTYIFKYVNN
jgi:hypothetical protein